MKKAITFVLVSGLFTGIGSVYQLAIVPYMVVATVIVITLLIALDKIAVKYYPVYIFGLALSLIWQTSMIGTYIVGVDIHSEYMVVLRTIETGWDWNWGNAGNTSVILTVLTPALAKLGFNPIWQFKALYPLVAAFVPVVLFYAFRNVFGAKRAYFGALFFMIMPMFTMEAVSMVKSQWAYLFLAGIVWCMTSDMIGWRKAITIGGFAVGTIVSHYTVGIITILYLVGIFTVLSLTNWWKLKGLLSKRTIPLRYALPTIACVLAFFLIWFTFIGYGSMIRQVQSIFGGVYANMSHITVMVEEPTIKSTDIIPETRAIGLPDDEEEQSVMARSGDATEYTQPTSQATYLHRQAKMVRSAIGLDFFDVSAWGKAFRVFQYMTQFMLLAGLYFIFRHRRQYNLTAEYEMGVIGGFTLLFCSVFFPYFTVMTVTTTRLYAITLFFIAPLLVIGFEKTVGKVLK